MIELCLSLCPTDFEHTVIDSGHVWACDRITSIITVRAGVTADFVPLKNCPPGHNPLAGTVRGGHNPPADSVLFC